MSNYNRNTQKNKNPWTKNQAPKQNGLSQKRPEEKFKEAQNKLQEAAQKYAKEYESSEDEGEMESETVIDAMLKSYGQSDVGRTKQFLDEVFVSGACTCLICISSVKRTDAIWSCLECYCFFHLMCIQRWSKDTITQKKQALEDQIQVRQVQMKWGCPKCRLDYYPEDIPTEYRCFCKKSVNPKFQSLIVPHSCGEICGKSLQPVCGHKCLLLCHPGPCPPCPKTIEVACFCGSSPALYQRCSSKQWSCNLLCNKALSCGKHKCAQKCHPGDCLPCPKKSIQKCLCRSNQKLRDCSTPIWQCEKLCDKPLACGFHNCTEVCHPENCGECILSKPRNCPCGKSTHELLCTEETPTCGDTCNKLLECGMHICNQRCHKDKCSLCLETVTKACRCGLHVKEVQCKKPYLCETKCKQMKDCNKHPCNRKCCDGSCPPCEKPCGRTLSCRKHACSSVCHRGPCYPCNLTESVYCRCGGTSTLVPCGKKSRTRPPKCLKQCMFPTECHHESREPHRCHFGDCFPCKQICNKSRSTCSHNCPSPCHSAVLMKLPTQKASTPCEEKAPQLAKKSLPCPNCMIPIAVTCLGGHETADWPCHMAKPSSCQRSCGRKLACGNHFCSKPCHLVLEAPNELQAGQNCEKCEGSCTKDRPENCQHTCLKPCHPGLCPPCKQMIRIKCHCGLNQPYIVCKDWTATVDNDALLSCGNQCPNNFPCGHRCKSNCHAGVCPNPEQCKKKIKVACPCKRLKKEFSCETHRKGAAEIFCDDECLKRQQEENQLKAAIDERKRKEKELLNQRELEKYEKKFQSKKKNRDKKIVTQAEETHFFKKYWFYICGFIVSLIAVYLVLF